MTLRDVAHLAGVSHTTVSNAYNRPERLSAAVRDRVLAAAATLGYAGPDPVAAGLATRRVGTLGVLFTEELGYAFSDPAAVLFLRGVAGVGGLADVGLTLLPAPPVAPGGQEQAGAAVAAAVRRAVVDGFLIYSVSDQHPGLLAATSRGLPVVVVDEPEPRPGLDAWPFVGIDDRQAARACADLLTGLGHRRVGVLVDGLASDRFRGHVDRTRLTGTAFAVVRNRLEGYLEGLAATGVGAPDVPVLDCGGNTVEAGRWGLTRLLEEPAGRRPTAVLAMTDQLALGVLAEARDRGLAVPDQLSVVGFDDLPQAAEISPALTTVRQPLREKGRTAAELLLGLIDRADGDDGPPARTLLPVELVERASTAPPPD